MKVLIACHTPTKHRKIVHPDEESFFYVDLGPDTHPKYYQGWEGIPSGTFDKVIFVFCPVSLIFKLWSANSDINRDDFVGKGISIIEEAYRVLRPGGEIQTFVDKDTNTAAVDAMMKKYGMSSKSELRDTSTFYVTKEGIPPPSEPTRVLAITKEGAGGKRKTKRRRLVKNTKKRSHPPNK